MWSLIVGVALGATAPQAWCQTYAGALAMDPSSQLAVTLYAVAEDADVAAATGSVSVRVEIATDPSLGAFVSSLEVLGSSISVADVTLHATMGTGISVTGSSSGLGLSASTTAPMIGVATGAGGSGFSQPLPELSATSGSASLGGFAAGVPISRSANFGLISAVLESDPSQVLTAQLVVHQSDLAEIELSLPVNSLSLAEDDPFQILLGLDGTLMLSGSLAVVTSPVPVFNRTSGVAFLLAILGVTTLLLGRLRQQEL